MNSFLKTFLASLLAFVAGSLILFMFTVTLLVGVGLFLGSFGEASVPALEDHSVLRIDLNQPISDDPGPSFLSDLDVQNLRLHRNLSLLEVLGAIDQAASDPRIEGIYLNISPASSLGMAPLGEIRTALDSFKASGKFILAYADFYSQGSYYLASVADKVYLNPAGTLLWKGLSAQVLFFKGLLDKLELKPEIVRHGSFKSAVEPLVLDRMSPENRLQMNVLTGTIWGSLLQEIAASRGIDSAALQAYASGLALTDAEAARRLGMVDSLAYGGEIETLLAEMTGEEEKPYFVSLGEYVAQKKASRKTAANKIAVIYAEGDIVDGGGGREMVGGDALAEKLARARRDDAVKGVVLRVNSPGGSALAAEVIWHEMERLRQEKPLIVSLGDVAASGGYYIAAPGDVILASPFTITGSIGVFGVLLDASEGLKNKLGITVDVAKTNPSADLGSPFRAVSPAERAYLLQGVERVYQTFVGHVAQGRNLTPRQADSLGGGRVWSGVSARENGLIDDYGGLMDAIALAADRAGVAGDFQISAPSAPSSRLEALLELLSVRMGAPAFEGELGQAFQEYGRLQRILSQPGVQALLPGKITLE